MTPIDIRSDTVTRPTPAMRAAMASAEVGDDVYAEDPSVNQLQSEAAAVLGKEAALLVTSGSQGNLSSVLAHCGRGDEIILAKDSHIFKYEAGTVASLGGIQPNTLEIRKDGTLDLDEIVRAIRPLQSHYPISRLICLENTQGGAWGAPLSAAYIGSVAAIARKHGLKLHIDGARLFNASAALRTPVAELVKDADSVTFCLSKGLCAPVGSLVAGSKEFIGRVHRARKSLGGGMRQAGIIAAPGLVALREMSKWERLQEDHDNARALAKGLAAIPFIEIDLERVRTNMVFFALSADAPITVGQLSSQLAQRGVLANPYSPIDRLMRMVTHYDFKREQIEPVLEAVRAVLEGAGQRKR